MDERMYVAIKKENAYLRKTDCETTHNTTLLKLLSASTAAPHMGTIVKTVSVLPSTRKSVVFPPTQISLASSNYLQSVCGERL